MSHPRYSFLVLLVAAAGLAAGCAGTRMSAPGEMRGGMMTDQEPSGEHEPSLIVTAPARHRGVRRRVVIR